MWREYKRERPNKNGVYLVILESGKVSKSKWNNRWSRYGREIVKYLSVEDVTKVGNIPLQAV